MKIIDLAFRIFCEPGKDSVIVCPPTYGMYGVCAHINNVEVKEAKLTYDFQLDVEAILEMVNANTKLIFICSPNNPTGNSMKRQDIEVIINNFNGLVIIDEAYINFSRQKTFLQELTEYENLVVMQTLSKAWGLAGLRLGLGFASERIIEIFNNVKPPYNINESSQQIGIQALQNIDKVNATTKDTIKERSKLFQQFSEFSFIKQSFASDANFILIKVDDADDLYHFLSQQKIIVRNRSKEPLCENCLRITVGTSTENDLLIKALKQYK